MRQLDIGEQLKVGDSIVTSHAFGGSRFEITRVTKRYAFSKRESDGYEHKFKSVCALDMAVPYRPYSCVNYSVFRGGK
jgi:hypothetical protein